MGKNTDIRQLIKIGKKVKEKRIHTDWVDSLELKICTDISFINVGDDNSQIGYIIRLKDKRRRRCSI